MELIYENGQPSYYREKTDLLTWGTEKGGIIAEPIYPSGWLIRPSGKAGSLTLNDVDAQKVRALSEINSPVILRGFIKTPNKEYFTKKAYDFGVPLPWKFGLVLDVKDKGSDTGGLNNVLSAEWMPWHFDGLFKTKTELNEAGQEVVRPNPPR